MDLEALLETREVFKNVSAFEDYANTLLTKDEWRKSFAAYENLITGLYEACKPEILGKPVVRSVAVFQHLRGVLDAVIEQTDIDAVALRVGELLDYYFFGWPSPILTIDASIAMPSRSLRLSRPRCWPSIQPEVMPVARERDLMSLDCLQSPV